MEKERGRMKGNPPPQLPCQENGGSNTLSTQGMSRATIPVVTHTFPKHLALK